MQSALDGLSQRTGESPFAAIPEIHFARWVIVPALRDRHGRLMIELGSYLLFCSEFDGSVRRHLSTVRSRLTAEADAVWGNCTGYPGAGSNRFGRYLLRHRIRPGYSIIAYPDASVAQVRESLALRDRLAHFAAGAGDLNADELKVRWRDTFPADLV